jgi:uncharacterized protein (DUF1800 family)
MARGHRQIEHVLRRAGFGASVEDLASFEGLSLPVVTDFLVNIDEDEDVDRLIGAPGRVQVTTRGAFSPNTNIEDARQRWLFRMVHTGSPLREKMALFWHNHFATAYSKVAAFAGAQQGARMMAGKPGEVPGPPGQIELFRRQALGSFRDLLVGVAKDAAMLVWLDGRTNTRQRPQENFAREIMELFTFGLGNYTEQDVYAAARVFTGWNLQAVGNVRTPSGYYEFLFRPEQHDTAEKTFTFPVYRDGRRTIPARSGDAGMQDGLDFINALATHPNTARRLARRLWEFFVSETAQPPSSFVETAAEIYLQNRTEMRPVVRYILRSAWFNDPANYYARYSWPVEYVVRAVKEMGWSGYSIDNARTPLTNMGQTLFEPPDVAGWALGDAWFSTGAMLARMNFAASLAFNQKFNLGRASRAFADTPERLLEYFLDRMSPADYDGEPFAELLDYLQAGEPWTGSEAQLNVKAPGLARLIAGSAEYQLV